MAQPSLPDTDVARVRRWIDARNAGLPERAVGLLRYDVDIGPLAVTILECRPPWRGDDGSAWTRSPIARLRYTKSTGTWTLYWPDCNSKFHRYEDLDPTPMIERLLAEIDADPTCIFWG